MIRVTCLPLAVGNFYHHANAEINIFCSLFLQKKSCYEIMEKKKGLIQMNIAFQKHFFKETLVLLVLLCLLPTFSMAANDFYIKEADMVVSTEKDWICLAKDTQNVDLEGTPFNYVGMDALVQQQITNLNSSQYEMIKAVLLYMNDDYQMIEAQLMVDQSEESKETWDISLYPNAESQVDETVTETYYWDMKNR